MQVIEKGCKINASQANAYLIIPGIVYHLSGTLDKGNIHDNLGQKKDMQLTQFLCKYGYAMRKRPTVMLHVGNMHYCANINDKRF